MRYLIAVLALTVAAPAYAQQLPCGERDKIVAEITTKYKEMPRAMAITGGNSFMEIYVSPSGTWTTMITAPNGQTCIVGAGEGWEDIEIKPAGTSL